MIIRGGIFLKIGELFRYSRPYDPTSTQIDELPNYFHYVYMSGMPLPLLEAGINPIAAIKDANGLSRRPAILISSSPHKAGSMETPWEDTFDPDNGHIRYYGDNKSSDQDPGRAPGNKVLLEAFKAHSSPDQTVRENHGVPLLFFRRVAHGGRAKGQVLFQGLGIIQSVELITQYDAKNQRSFANFVFDFVVFSLKKEHENFAWEWINDRRTKNLGASYANKDAPQSWKDWLVGGPDKLDRCRRRVSKLLVTPTSSQKPKVGSKESDILQAVYEFYDARKNRFEALALFVTEQILKRSGDVFRRGWITAATGDGGADFIGRLDIGSGFSTIKIIVLGQAKCEQLSTPTNGQHIARTVARLKRGWIGAYVTTSYFSEPVQQEIIEDQYPILMINGLKIAEILSDCIYLRGGVSLQHLLQEIDNEYDQLVKTRRPEEVLYD